MAVLVSVCPEEDMQQTQVVHKTALIGLITSHYKQ
jgi:hypothetical protein